MLIYLFRHGQTVYNADGERFCGSSDVGLTALGWQQVRESAELIRDAQISKIYHSGLRRSYETASAIAELHPQISPVSFVEVPSFREVGFGVFEGLTRAEVAKMYPDVYADWLVSPEEVSIPGGEDLRERQAEVFAEFRTIAATNQAGDIAIVAHNTINRLLLAALMGADAGAYRTLVQRNACLNVIEITEDQDVRIHAINVVPQVRAAAPVV
ncbi:histidine phosphatase family protein [Alicyclobacillus fastidiosus]|uniref:Histidine phosphatase family protein n=1 Tax=Alicyclobacillus fastidiosus TaxID=392011 RepID=A0ABV5AE25_9BACL|nr:histidine phosphatase family protein [Alicyclobacillus fastidiosus]WEH09883.1 histidine phosphatase family protein [Alicyclobacillus fastidiosus]